MTWSDPKTVGLTPQPTTGTARRLPMTQVTAVTAATLYRIIVVETASMKCYSEATI